MLIYTLKLRLHDLLKLSLHVLEKAKNYGTNNKKNIID